MKTTGIIRAADLFCGAGGTSTGLYRACHGMGRRVDLLAINHWRVAVETHAANHPDARHICSTLDSIRPEDAVKSGRLDILVASPECTHHSIARGGRPVLDQMRASAWIVLRWIETLHVDNVLIENVQEFREWGPICASGKPLKSRKGETYRAFLNALRSFGYTVDDRILNAADYGDATSRRRLFIMARRGRKRIIWPEVTHGAPGTMGDLTPYRTAREIIDWSIKGDSIFSRKRPLAPATMARIAAGLKKFGGRNAEPFLVMLYGSNDARSVDRPLPTVTANGQHIGLAQPFVIHTTHAGGERCHNIDKPLPTITTAHRGEMALVEPFLVRYHGNHQGKRDGERRVHSLDNPVPTLDTSNRYALCEPFVTIMKGKSNARKIDAPLPTITTQPHLYLCEPFLVPFFGERDGQQPRSHSVDEPLPTVTSHGAGALVEPFLVKYYGTAGARSVDEPLDTITTRGHFGLVEVKGKYQIDIRFRMLQPHELAAAMSFENYQFAGNKGEQVKQIGNAVPVRLAQALCTSLLAA